MSPTEVIGMQTLYSLLFVLGGNDGKHAVVSPCSDDESNGKIFEEHSFFVSLAFFFISGLIYNDATTFRGLVLLVIILVLLLSSNFLNEFNCLFFCQNVIYQPGPNNVIYGFERTN